MDKYRAITKLPVAEERIKHLLQRMDMNRNAGSYQTQEALSQIYAEINNSILKGFKERIYNLPKVIKGTPVNEELLNQFLLGVFSEVQYILASVRGTADLAEQNFNFAVSLIRKLQADLKYCKQDLSTYSLYASNFGDAMQFGETFSNAVNIDRGSSFLKESECFMDLAEGTISLPRMAESDTWDIDTIEVGTRSNGVLGNNVEAGVPVRGNIKSMYDKNTDTWTEYERVVEVEDDIGIKLELKIALKDTQVLNGIKIHPVFLGGRTGYLLSSIEVSEDGLQWISLKDDVRVADFLDETPEYRYHLSPHSSRFAGEFNITFAPRFTKFVRILIKQSSSIVITDTNGNRKLRYAIGIKEIEFYGHKYETAGEIISTEIPFSRDIDAVGIQSLVDPPNVMLRSYYFYFGITLSRS
jgi:hypothetical protein